MNDEIIFSRRQFLRLMSMGTLVVTLPRFARSEDHGENLPHLFETDPTAAALGYREDAAKVDTAKYPAHKSGQVCSNCKFFGGTEKTPWASCQIFPGKAVSAKGWCSAYNAKT